MVLGITDRDEDTARAVMTSLEGWWGTSGMVPVRRDPSESGVRARRVGHKRAWNAGEFTEVDHSMTQGPAPRSLSDEALSALLAGQQFGTLATVKQSGHPHLTTMLYSWDPEARIVRLSTTADRIKVKHLQRNPRAALHVQGATFGRSLSPRVRRRRPRSRRFPATQSGGNCSR